MREYAKYWKAADFDHLELMRATYITHSFARHFHEGFAIGIIEAGAEAFYYRHENHVAVPGDIIIINPGEIHTGQAVHRGGWWRYRVFYPSAALMQSISQEITGQPDDVPFFDDAIIHDEEMAKLLCEAHAALETSSLFLERGALVRLALGQLMERHAVSRPVSMNMEDEHSSIRLAKEYLESHFQENVALETLSQIAGLSPFHLSRIFQKQVGLPPHAYLTHLRVQHARKLLPSGLPLVDVALASGFSDQSHFTRWFKRVVGVTPGQYAAHV